MGRNLRKKVIKVKSRKGDTETDLMKAAKEARELVALEMKRASKEASMDSYFTSGNLNRDAPVIVPFKTLGKFGAVWDVIGDNLKKKESEATNDTEIDDSIGMDENEDCLNDYMKDITLNGAYRSEDNQISEGKEGNSLYNAIEGQSAMRNISLKDEYKLNYVAPIANKAILPSEILSTEWDYALIGYFMDMYPGYYALKDLCRGWEVSVDIKTHESGWLMFRFNKEEDVLKVLNGGPYTIWGKTLMLKRMPYAFHFDDFENSCMPVWVRLRNLPMCCWTQKALEVIGSFIGKPLYTDMLSQTKETVSHARMLVEVDAARPLVREVTVQIPNVEWQQQIEYEFEPRYCVSCRRFGHVTGNCAPVNSWPEKCDIYLKREEAKSNGNGAKIDKSGKDGFTAVVKRKGGNKSDGRKIAAWVQSETMIKGGETIGRYDILRDVNNEKEDEMEVVEIQKITGLNNGIEEIITIENPNEIGVNQKMDKTIQSRIVEKYQQAESKE